MSKLQVTLKALDVFARIIGWCALVVGAFATVAIYGTHIKDALSPEVKALSVALILAAAVFAFIWACVEEASRPPSKHRDD